MKNWEEVAAWEEGMGAWENSCAVLPPCCWEEFPAAVVMPMVVGATVVTVLTATSAEEDRYLFSTGSVPSA